MTEFKKPSLGDRGWVNECLASCSNLSCEYSFGNIFVWAVPYSAEICRLDDFLVIKWGRGNDIAFSPPIGKGDFKAAVEKISDYAKSLGVQTRFYGVTDDYKDMFSEFFGNDVRFEYDDGSFEYIYSTEKMSSLSGKKYHSKRNHITNFIRSNPDWSFERIDKSNISECIDMHLEWIKEKDENDPEYSMELEAVLTAFNNFDALGFVGGLIRTGGQVAAYTMGEPLMNKDCFVTHFEKASPDIRGAYPIINREFTKNCLLSYSFVNREEDMGIPGLRKAKQSYNPEILLKKCVAYL